ncbi:MAG: hypothetical protein HYZ57_12230 [Acidobacteria bacterium]|nr:hypothetical protein [Acidobacteriota bacterium]
MVVVKRLGTLALLAASASAGIVAAASPRIIEIVADKDNRFKIVGSKKPIITAHAKEVLRLRIIAHKGSEMDKDGTVHSLTIKQLKDQGWDLRVKEGTHEFAVVAPPTPGEYTIECAVKCGDGHDDMRMKLLVQ